MTAQEILEALKGGFGDAITSGEVKGAEVALVARPEVSFEICARLRDMGFEYLDCVAGADYKDRLEAVYFLSSLEHPNKVSLRVPVPRDGPRVRSVTPLWGAADWHERETYDLFGIRFDGHPDPRRILLPEDWVGYPLRKDYQDERLVAYTPYEESKSEAAKGKQEKAAE